MAFPDIQQNQTAVYWGAPVNDGFGGRTWDDPVEIACRWETKEALVLRSNGQQTLSHSRAFVATDLDEDGVLFLGTLDDLDSGEEADPTTVTGAYSIVRFEKIPRLRGTTAFQRRAFL